MSQTQIAEQVVQAVTVERGATSRQYTARVWERGSAVRVYLRSRGQDIGYVAVGEDGTVSAQRSVTRGAGDVCAMLRDAGLL